MNTPENPDPKQPGPAPQQNEQPAAPAKTPPPPGPTDPPPPITNPTAPAAPPSAAPAPEPHPESASGSAPADASPATGSGEPDQLEKIQMSSSLGEVRKLSEADQMTYLACEEVIANGWATFVQVGLALATIRDLDLYTFEFKTFEEYCRTKWAYGRHYVNRLISAAQVFTHLVTNCHQKPEREGQVRPLIGLTPEQAQVAWDTAVERAAGGKITARLVKNVVQSLRGTVLPALAKSKSAPKKETIAQKRRRIDTAIGELLVLLSQRAAHTILTQKVEALNGCIQALFAKA